MRPLFVVCLVTAIVLAGCATVNPATLSDGRSGFVATCGGTAVTWSTCYAKATQRCERGYDIRDREQFVHEGFVKRNLYFSCKP
jgi:uncharacterized protein YceK